MRHFGTGFFIVLLILSSGCTIHKRLYRPGWNIEWHSPRRSTENLEVQAQSSEMSLNDKDQTEEVSFVSQTTERNTTVPEDKAVWQENTSRSVHYVSRTEISPDDFNIEKEDSGRVDVYEDRREASPVGSPSKFNGWYLFFLIMFYVLAGVLLYLGALYPFQVGLALLFPGSLLFLIDDRAGYLFGVFSGFSYIGLFFLSGILGFWGMLLLGFAGMLLALILATYIDDKMDEGQRKGDLPPPSEQ